MRLKRVEDKALIESQLLSDTLRALYHLGDLNDYYFGKCRWYFICDGDTPITLILMYESYGKVLMPLGQPSGLQFFLEHHQDLLQEKFYGTWMTEHDAVMGRVLAIPDRKRMYRMAVTCRSFLPSPADDRVKALDESHVDAVQALLGSYPDNFFEPYQLATGYYRGIFDNRKLVSMAGVHTTNRENRVAAIGNIVTDRAYRGRGLAGAVTSKLVGDLLCDHDLVGLNVNQGNETAIRVYRRLGFEIGIQFYEGYCSIRGPQVHG